LILFFDGVSVLIILIFGLILGLNVSPFQSRIGVITVTSFPNSANLLIMSVITTTPPPLIGGK